MKIQEGFVFDSASGHIIGFVDMGDLNSMLQSFETNMIGQTEECGYTYVSYLCQRNIY